MSKQKLVVVGNGMAGARTVEEILDRGGGEQFDITMFGDEPYGNYNRILLSNVVNGSQDASEIFINPMAWYTDNGVALHAGERVIGIDRHNKRVTSDKGTVEAYDKLIIATGSRAFIPPIENVYDGGGQLRSGVFAFRSLDDCNAIMSHARQSERAAVIGGGLLGLEAARGLSSHGCQVAVIHLSDGLMNAQLDAIGSGMLRAAMEEMGVTVYLEALTEGIVGENQVQGLRLRGGKVIDCDMVVISAGIRPNSEIGRECGLSVERAIVVDNQMRSVDDPDVYVVGECAQHRGMVYGLVAPLYEQGRVLADHITGKRPDAAYTGSKLATKLKVMGVEVASMGTHAPENDDEVVQFQEPKKGVYKKLVVRKGRLAGAILMGDLSKAAYLMQAYDKNTPLPDERLSVLFDLGAPEVSTTFEEMPASSQICNCNGVCKGDIAERVAAGDRTLQAVMSATRAGMGCGSCKSMVKDLVEFLCDGQLETDETAEYYVPSIPLRKADLIAAIRERGLRSVSSVVGALATAPVEPSSKPALASLMSVVWHGKHDEERDARFINDRVHANIQKDGSFTVVPEMAGGICTPAQLRRIADVADKYAVPLVKLTGGQRIDLVGVQKENLPAVWRELDMPAGSAWTKGFRTCKSCIGIEYCRFGLGHSMNLAVRLENRFRGLDCPAKVKMATAGCPRNCSEAYVKDVGVVAVEGGQWQIYVGGAAGAEVRKADLLCVVDSEDAVVRIAGRFIQYYRETANYKERTYSFVPRVGLEKIRAAVVDDAEGEAARLDADMEAAVEATYDVWLERDRPQTQHQFRTQLPVVG